MQPGGPRSISSKRKNTVRLNGVFCLQKREIPQYSIEESALEHVFDHGLFQDGREGAVRLHGGKQRFFRFRLGGAPGDGVVRIGIQHQQGIAAVTEVFTILHAGSKFGGIGLTQSFALELVPYNIKVNAVCPGNFLDGPLWSDPEKGLFVQYLRAGKVPGAKTVEDVRRFYESKVPMNRGCQTIDVARAIFYIVEQTYETGQAVPVTGGQSMLN